MKSVSFQFSSSSVPSRATTLKLSFSTVWAAPTSWFTPASTS